jgi:hypothetical protein
LLGRKGCSRLASDSARKILDQILWLSWCAEVCGWIQTQLLPCKGLNYHMRVTTGSCVRGMSLLEPCPGENWVLSMRGSCLDVIVWFGEFFVWAATLKQPVPAGLDCGKWREPV